MKINLPSKEDMSNYYISSLKTAKESAQYFNISEATFRRLLKKYNIKKTDELKYQTHLNSVKEKKYKKPSKEEIEKYYIEQNLTKKECLDIFKCSSTTFSRWLSFYNIKKTPEKISEIAIKTQSYKKKLIPNQKELEQEYINTPYTREEICKKYDVSLSTFARWLTTLKITKNKEQVQKTIEESNLKKFGVSNSQKTDILHIDIWDNRDKMLYFLKTKKDGTKYTTTELQLFFNVGETSVLRKINDYNLRECINLNKSFSDEERKVFDSIYGLSDDFVLNDREILKGKEIDIYCPSKKIGIEFNGTYWHCSLKKEKNYHYQKSLEAEKKGIRLIHIYEYEWNNPKKVEILQSLLKIAFGEVSEKIYARKCEIKEITNKEAKLFNEKNHLQGHRNAQVTYGLFYNNQLVQLMSFSKTKYNKNLKNDNSWEIIRGCPGSNNIVVGGVGKLFKHFIKEYDPEEVFSYCDFNKFDGSGYEAIGMKLIGYTGPDMKWVMPDMSVVERSPKKHKDLKEKAKAQIFGAGSKKYLWTKYNN